MKKREAIWQTYQIMRHWHISVVLSRYQYIIQLPVNFPVMCFKQKKKIWTKWPEVCGHLTITSTCLLDIPFHQHGHYHGAAKSLRICAPSSKPTLMRSGIRVAINVPDLPQCVQWSLRTSLCVQSWCEGSFLNLKVYYYLKCLWSCAVRLTLPSTLFPLVGLNVFSSSILLISTKLRIIHQIVKC